MTKLNFERMKQSQRLAQDRAKAPDPRFDDLAKIAEQQRAAMLNSLRNEMKQTPVRTTTMVITPEMATKWLEGNIHNRPLRQKDVNLWSREMSAGHWLLNGESIIFAEDGTLLDGQHRLWACVDSGTSFESVVVFGAPKEAFLTIDQGRRRSTADHLKAGGVQAANLTTVGAVAADILRYRDNAIFSNDKSDPKRIIALVQDEPGIVEWCGKSKRSPTGLIGFSTPIAVTLYLGSRGLPTEAEAFLEGWVTGSDLSAGNPILTLRQRVLSKPPRVRWERLLLVVSAWNAFAQKRPLRKIMGSLRSDKFPMILGDVE